MNETAYEKSGLKKTRHRQIIYSALEKQDYPVTAEEFFFALSKEDRINLSTVYRTLNSFVEAGLVKKEINSRKENVFSLEKEEDNHVLVCVKCHKKVPLKGCPYHEVNEAIEEQTGFTIMDHNVEIYGVCPDCNRKK